MSAPHESQDDDERLVRYLLSLLPAEEAEHLDEAAIVDGQVAARLRVVENDLVDAYVRGGLPDDTRRRFETVYLASARRRQKVEFAEHFVRAADRPIMAVTGDSATAGPQAAAFGAAAPRRLQQEATASRVLPWRGLAIAAMLVLATSGGVFFGERRVRGGLEEARSQREAFERQARTLEQQLASRESANADTVRELEQARTSLAALAARATADGAGGGGSAASRIVFVLAPPTRGAGRLPELTVPSGSDAVAFALQLEVDDFPRYEAVLKAPSNDRVMWRSARVAAQSSKDPATVTAVVPARVLKAQSYVLELSGYPATGGDDAQILGAYAFRIVRQ